jgi:homoserine kinase
LHPRIEVETGAARRLIGDQVALTDATRQWANVGALVAALYTSDLALLSRSLVDHIAEPKRASLVPGLAAIKSAAMSAGALGCSLSGSGPSIFALAASLAIAQAAGDAMQRAFTATSNVGSDLWVCPVGRQGARVIDIHR